MIVFKNAVPADVIVTMGGTNNVWRHADLAPEIADDIADEILDFYAKAVSQARVQPNGSTWLCAHDSN